ncbi:thiaminase II [Virgibacillus profundi]|uniref:Aminopyrimidine aminohydrolase n=1 Tax=Virgibacillus profundi TaxID=2024555 RepID=A0A2A2I8Y6_9BACI|nr:thiaminase II [Virgibacillus profundi]PAV28179.1 thiaminase II [Virgibacillus profundi]PXY52484.1 thiaminase II [Virgibacillus profundi]
MLFTDRLFKKVEPVWSSYLDHPFVKGIGEGTVDEDKFIHYMRQDYVYLIEYSRVFAIGSAKAKDLKTMTIFANLLHGTMNYEMDLHREYAAKIGISNEELEATGPSSTMTAYTSYMISQAQLGGVENSIAAVLACAWSYSFIGKELARWPGALDHELYGNWVRMYSSDEFAKIAEDCKELINDITKDKPEDELKALEDIVLRTSYFEYMFWDMAENISTWPVKELAR